MLEIFAESLALARFIRPDRCAVHWAADRLRLHVGGVVVLTLQPHALFVALHPAAESVFLSRFDKYRLPESRIDSADIDAYKIVKSVNRTFRSDFVDGDGWTWLRPAHQLYMQAVLASNYKPRVTTLEHHDHSAESYVLSAQAHKDMTHNES